MKEAENWVTQISLDELKKTYSDSVYLNWVGNLFHFVSAIALIIMMVQYFLLTSETRKGFFCGILTLILILILIFSVFLNKFRMNGLYKNIFHFVQAAIACLTLYCMYLSVYESPLGQYCLHIYEQGNTSQKALPQIIIDDLKLFFQCFIICIISETVAVILKHNRSTGARLFLIPASVLWSVCGIIAFPNLLCCGLIIFIFFMPIVLWISIKNRNGLFGEHALSHRQLKSVLQQRKENEVSIVIPDDNKDVSNRKAYLMAAWIGFIGFAVYLLFIRC